MRTHLADFRLSVPPLPPRHVSRPRLVTALERATEAPLTLVSAGAGAGKTVLLTEFANQAADRIVWLTLSAVDVKPTRFWALLARALRQADALSPAEAARVTGLPLAVIPVTEECPGCSPLHSARILVVIDGADLIKDPGVLHAIDSLIRGCGHDLRLVLLARTDPLLPLHRYRLGGLMRELRGADLAMTRPEIEAVLAAHGVKLLPREIDTAGGNHGGVDGRRPVVRHAHGRPKPAR